MAAGKLNGRKILSGIYFQQHSYVPGDEDVLETLGLTAAQLDYLESKGVIGTESAGADEPEVFTGPVVQPFTPEAPLDDEPFAGSPDLEDDRV